MATQSSRLQIANAGVGAAYNPGMSKIVSGLMLLVWSCWFGGLVALFIFVTTLFRQDRAIAIEAAPRMFHVFEQYQLILATILLLLLFGSWLLRRSAWMLVLFILIGLASGAAAFATA